MSDGAYAYRVQKFDTNGNYLGQWGSHGTGDGQFTYSAFGIATDPAGNVYVGDSTRIQKFDANGNYLTQWGSHGNGPGQFNYGFNIAIDKSSNVYVADFQNKRIQQFDTNGNYLTEWSNINRDSGQADQYSGIVVNAAGSIYLTAYSYSSSGVLFESIQKYSCHPASENKHLFFFDNGSETWGSGFINPSDNFLLRYFDGTQRFGSGYANVPTRVVRLEGDDPLQPENLLLCRGTNCEEGAIINVQPGGNVVEQARWSPGLTHPVGTLLNGSWSHIVSTGKNKLLLYNNATYQAKLIYLKGVLNTDYNAAQIVKNFTITSSPFGSAFSDVINTPKGLLFYGGGIVNNRVVLDRLMTFKETYQMCNGQPCRLAVTDSSSYFVGLRAPGRLARVRNNSLYTTPGTTGDLLLSYDATSGNAKLYTINTSGIPYFQQTGTTQAIGAGWTQIAGIKDEILFYNQNDYSYALGTVKPSGFPVRPNLTLTREVAGSSGILGGWSHLVPLMPTI